MADTHLIDGLVATYRTLNMTVRSLPEDSNPAVLETVRHLRDEELRFSQALKARVALGQPMPEISEGEKGVIGTEGANDSLAELVAQFGTARESTLAMLRGVDNEAWHATDVEARPLTEIVDAHLANDQKHLSAISAAIGAAALPT